MLNSCLIQADSVSSGKTTVNDYDDGSSRKSTELLAKRWFWMRPPVEEDVSGIDPAVGEDEADYGEDSTSNDSTYGE